MDNLTSMVQIATKIAMAAFAGKKDKAGIPYIKHLQRVSMNAAKYYINDPKYAWEVEVVGMLHDILEDCPEWTMHHLRAIFGPGDIVEAIAVLTHSSYETSYEQYIEGIKKNSYARAVKLADLEDNMNLLRLDALDEDGIERIKKYHRAFKMLVNGGEK